MKNKKSLLGVLGLALVVGIAGSLAYFSQELTKTNEFDTAKYETTIEEEFTPPTEWLPGVDVKKEVAVKNTGNVAVVVKATITEEWSKNLSNTFTDEEGNVQDAAIKNMPNVVVYEDGMNLAEQHGKWVLYEGTYYYMGAVEENETSPLLLASVKLNPLLDVTTKEVNEVVSTDEDGKTVTTTTTEAGLYGYDDAHFTLTVKATTMQASPSAVETWGDNPVVNYIVANFATIKESI